MLWGFTHMVVQIQDFKNKEQHIAASNNKGNVSWRLTSQTLINAIYYTADIIPYSVTLSLAFTIVKYEDMKFGRKPPDNCVWSLKSESSKKCYQRWVFNKEEATISLVLIICLEQKPAPKWPFWDSLWLERLRWSIFLNSWFVTEHAFLPQQLHNGFKM